MITPSIALVQLKFSTVILWFSSKRVGNMNIREVINSQMTAIHPMGIDQTPRSKALLRNVVLETVSLSRMGIA